MLKIKKERRQFYIKQIKGYNIRDCYLIDEYGNIFNNERNKWLKPTLDKHGYLQVKLYENDNKRHSRLVHRLVAMTYLDYDESKVYKGKNSGGLTVDHIDGNKLNNHYTNLRWVDFLSNVNGAKELKYNGYEKNREDISIEIVKLVINDLLNLYSDKEIMKRRNVSLNFVQRISKKQRWRELTQNYNFKRLYGHKPRDEILTIVYYCIKYPSISAPKLTKILKNQFNFSVSTAMIYSIRKRQSLLPAIEYIEQNKFEPSETIRKEYTSV